MRVACRACSPSSWSRNDQRMAARPSMNLQRRPLHPLSPSSVQYTRGQRGRVWDRPTSRDLFRERDNRDGCGPPPSILEAVRQKQAVAARDSPPEFGSETLAYVPLISRRRTTLYTVQRSSMQTPAPPSEATQTKATLNLRRQGQAVTSVCRVVSVSCMPRQTSTQVTEPWGRPVSSTRSAGVQ